LWPDWLKNFVPEIADGPAETKCGAVVSVTQLEAVRLGAVPIVGTLQMFPLAARPCPASASATAAATAAAIPITPMNALDRCRMRTSPSPSRTNATTRYNRLILSRFFADVNAGAGSPHPLG